MKLLAIAHTAWGAVILAAAAWWAISILRVLPYMSTGTVASNLPVVATLAVVQCGPLVVLAALMFSLGGSIRRGEASARSRLLWTHGVLLVFAIGAIATGLLALQAAERSAARGGGLMGGFGLIPLAIGAFLAVLSVPAMAVAYFAAPARST